MDGEHSHPDYARAAEAAQALARLTAQVVALEAQVAELKARPTFALDYDYLDKPTDPQAIGREYVRLDRSQYDPVGPGWENTLRYLKIKPTFRAGRMAGALRPRMMRANGDATAYDDIPLLLDALDADGYTLRTQPYWEWGDDQTTWVELKCIGGLQSVELSTRYVKKALLRPL